MHQSHEDSWRHHSWHNRLPRSGMFFPVFAAFSPVSPTAHRRACRAPNPLPYWLTEWILGHSHVLTHFPLTFFFCPSEPSCRWRRSRTPRQMPRQDRSPTSAGRKKQSPTAPAKTEEPPADEASVTAIAKPNAHSGKQAPGKSLAANSVAAAVSRPAPSVTKPTTRQSYVDVASQSTTLQARNPPLAPKRVASSVATGVPASAVAEPKIDSPKSTRQRLALTCSPRGEELAPATNRRLLRLSRPPLFRAAFRKLPRRPQLCALSARRSSRSTIG